MMTSFSALIRRNHHHILTTVRRRFTTVTPSLTSTDNLHHLTSDQAVGKVTGVSDNIKRVSVECANSGAWPLDGSHLELMCTVRTHLSDIYRKEVMVGDDVIVDAVDWNECEGIIEDVVERKSEIACPRIANVEKVLVLFSLDQPNLNEVLLTRYLVAAESSGIAVTLVVNKSELLDKKATVLWKSKLRSWGYDPIFCSVKTKRGLKSLMVNLRDQTTVIVGPSGAGKSSLINALGGNNHRGHLLDDSSNSTLRKNWLDQASARIRRQEHATPHVSLLPLCGGGYLADTPGFNLPSPSSVTKGPLALCFPEVRNMIGSMQCASSDCLHLGERGCLVTTSWERYPHYCELLKEIEIRDEFQVSTLGTKH